MVGVAGLSGAALVGAALADAVPLPRPKPPIAAPHEPRSFAEAAGPGFDTASVTDKPTDCDSRLAQIAHFSLLPRLIGPGECGGADMVEIDTVTMPDRSRVEVKPAAVLRCQMAESFAAWLREEAGPRLAKAGSPIRAVENYDSYECRGRNRIPGAKISEHGKGNAIDVRSFTLADGRRLEPTDLHADKLLRVDLRASACHRFTTVLGPGSDGFHEAHIHLDIDARRNGYRICEWDVREPKPVVAAAAVHESATVDEAKPAEEEAAADEEAQPAVVNVPLPTPRPARLGHVKHSRRL